MLGVRTFRLSPQECASAREFYNINIFLRLFNLTIEVQTFNDDIGTCVGTNYFLSFTFNLKIINCIAIFTVFLYFRKSECKT